jgi:hypothetical protein
MLGLWVAYFVKTGFSIEGMLALLAFLLLLTVLHLLAILIKLNTEFFRLSTAAYSHFKASQ